MDSFSSQCTDTCGEFHIGKIYFQPVYESLDR